MGFRIGRRFSRPRFTLWALLVLITVVAIPLSYVAQRRAWNLKRKAAYESLESLNALFEFDKRPPLDNGIAGRAKAIWRELALENVLPGPVDAIILTGARPTEIGAALNDNDFELISLFPEARQVSVHGENEVSDAGLRILKQLPNLELLHLQSSARIQGDFLAQWGADCPLKVLRLHSLAGLQGKSLEVVSTFRKLETLTLRRCKQLDDDSLDSVAMPSSLKILVIEHTAVGDRTLRRWLSKPKLQELALDLAFSREISPSLQTQTELQKLFIRNAPLEDSDFVFLGECKSLRRLVLSGLPIRGAFLQKLSIDLPLQYVDLSHTLLVDDYAACLLRQTKLDRIDLDFTPVSGAFLTGRPQCTKLAYLQLTGCELSDAGKDALAKLQLQSPLSVELPLNWRIVDFQRIPTNSRFPILSRKPMSPAALANPHNPPNFPWEWSSQDVLSCKIDRCPADSMAPVLRLYEQARQLAGKRWEELEGE